MLAANPGYTGFHTHYTVRRVTSVAFKMCPKLQCEVPHSERIRPFKSDPRREQNKVVTWSLESRTVAQVGAALAGGPILWFAT